MWTEKDATRLINHPALDKELKPFIYALPIEIEILQNQQDKFKDVYKRQLINGAHGKMEYSFLEMTRWNMYSNVWDRLITWNLF